MFKDDELTQILDEGLRSYAEQVPLAGLEQRILNRVSVGNTPRPRWGYRLCGVGSVLALYFLILNHPTQRVPQQYAAKPAVASALMAETHPQPRVRGRRRFGPRRPDQFPTPAPMTATEKALLAMAERRELPPPDTSEPIAVTPIEIKPLEIESLQ